MVRPEASSKPAVTSPAAGLSEAEFTTLFSGSFRKLWLIAVGIIGDAALAEDAVQDAAMTALGKRDQFEPGTNFTAWMSQMVRFVALNQYRKQRKRKATSLEGSEIDVAAPAPRSYPVGATVRVTPRGDLPADQPHFDDRIMQALQGVADVARACLLLRTLEDLEYAEISVMLGIPEGTAMSHVHRTRQYLRERLAGAYGRVPTAGDNAST